MAGTTAGVITLSGCGSSPSVRVVTPTPPARTVPASAGFSWNVDNFNNNSAFAYFQVIDEMTLQAVKVDATLEPSLTTVAGGTQALCRGWISRGAAPAFVAGGSAASGPTAVSTDFGAVSIYNPAGVTVEPDAAALQDVFYSANLRSWVPITAAAATTARSVSVAPALILHAGDYLVFEIEQQGVSSNVALQAILRYQ